MSEDSSLALVSRMNSHAEWTMPCSDVGLVLGEVWTPEGSLNDECAICGCMASFIMCSYHVCPPLTCKTPVRIPGSCCPSCPDIEHITKREKSCLTEEGIMTNSGDSWAVNKCMTCICIDGRITCKSKSCFLKDKGSNIQRDLDFQSRARNFNPMVEMIWEPFKRIEKLHDTGAEKGRMLSGLPR